MFHQQNDFPPANALKTSKPTSRLQARSPNAPSHRGRMPTREQAGPDGTPPKALNYKPPPNAHRARYGSRAIKPGGRGCWRGLCLFGWRWGVGGYLAMARCAQGASGIGIDIAVPICISLPPAPTAARAGAAGALRIRPGLAAGAADFTSARPGRVAVWGLPGRWGGPARDLLPNTSVPFS